MKNLIKSITAHLNKRSYFFNLYEEEGKNEFEIVESRRLTIGFDRNRLSIYDMDIEAFCNKIEQIDYTKRNIDQSESAQLKRRSYFFNLRSNEDENVKFEMKESRALGANNFEVNKIRVYAVDLEEFFSSLEELIEFIKNIREK